MDRFYETKKDEAPFGSLILSVSDDTVLEKRTVRHLLQPNQPWVALLNRKKPRLDMAALFTSLLRQ